MEAEVSRYEACPCRTLPTKYLLAHAVSISMNPVGWKIEGLRLNQEISDIPCKQGTAYTGARS